MTNTTTPKLKLTYFGFKGRGEPIRLALAIGGVEFEDERIGPAGFMERKSTLPFGSLPVLEVDGMIAAQSDAILRYAGRLGGLYPEDLQAALKVDEFCNGVDDLGAPLAATFSEKDQEKKLALRKALVENTFPRYLNALDKLVAGRFATGDEVTIADVRLYCMIAQVKSGALDGIPTDLTDSYPNLSSVYEAFGNIPQVKAWNEAHA
mmetsp:Transcript_6536/g.13962  ORF Transcript_6536/g.13962 Transcript_6536/m.13962 type:complete len:207 (-) Transcript_6536:189-809(-)|eukprot:CAMPEP_0185847154 /NCGR_PEP_ID=MMETSP1354-20130828/2536_1 /TAXON_ID=708628 /ORGANISM="Erythrolobus madagascarensis, Strain CCMP3276" /LENGTH=206 /DNA_ID=CAMNT_0028547413 /DNA_START=20 /DNA_END=640 /DNA_ORIENTATION=-